MIFPGFLSAITTFAEYNLVFDVIVLLFTIIYLFVGIERGFKNSLLWLVFNLVSIALATIVCKFVYPMFSGAIPVVAVHMIPNAGLAFFLTAMFKVIVEVIFWLILFGVFKGLFKKIMTFISDYEYVSNKSKSTFGRLVSGILTAGLAFILSSGAIAATNGAFSYTMFNDYRGEMNQTFVAKYGEKGALDFYDVLVNTYSVPNQHDCALKSISDDKYTYSDIPSYRESIYRLMVAKDVEAYLAAIDFENNKEVALSRLSQDLCVWASIAERSDTSAFGTKNMLNNFVLPIVTEIAKTEVNTENVFVFPYENHTSTYSEEVNNYLNQIF